MQNFVRLLLLVAVAAGPALFAQGARKLGEIKVEVDATTISVRISSGSSELQALAQSAFAAHGRYRIEGSNANYDIKFTAVAPTQVRVDVTKGAAAAPVVSQIVSGTTPRQALLRAADVAVEKTNGAGLRGFFTARLTFVSQRGGKGDIFFSDLFLGEANQLTRDNALTLSPRWAPDGSRIVYTSYYRNGAPDIYVHDIKAQRRDVFASFRGTNMGARFSPNGQQVAMVLSASGTPEIYVGGAQGRPSPVARTRSDATKSSPCWSPDGTQLVFAMEPGPQLYVMPAGGGVPRRLTVGFTYAAEPDWSRANPNKIVCTVRVGGRFQIAVFDLATGTGKVVSTRAAFDAVEPSWLADGRHIVYTARDKTTSVLGILDTETGKGTPLGQLNSATLQASVWTP